jgi:DNA-binding LytR/AlgR family response regulator
MKLKCLIAEDEPIAREILRSYIEKTDSLVLSAQFTNAIDAWTFLKSHSVDIMFLDIKMPQMSGLELLTNITNKPKTIITSAYRYYATDAFDLEVVDYLLKPYSYQRFQKAIRKAGADAIAEPTHAPVEKPYFFIKGNKELHKITFDDIAYVESQRDYVKFKLEDNSELTTRNTISYYEEFLPPAKFLRIHRSFIVPISKIASIDANGVKVSNHEIPVGRNYRQPLLDKIKAVRQS